ncbi:MAG: extracellular metalloprotease M10 family [Parcubacteria bacterium C7867-006]|nr:MAG: extracellular metalloprotease M10 family [Parcubacteria bacterium C7867-006]
MSNTSKNIISALILLGVIFYFRTTLQNYWRYLERTYFPCKSPISYSIGTFDTRFGVSKADFLSAMKEAEAIWEKPIGKDLFSYSTDGALKVNLIYDTRQETTKQLQVMGITLKNDKATYDEVKAKYETVLVQYNQEKAEFESRVSAFEIRKTTYETAVAQANRRGGADKTTYAKLTAEKEYLQNESASLVNLQNQLNKDASNVNSLVSALNDLAKALNINVKNYNTIGDNLGGEFDEGLYKVDANGEEIDIYQFDNRTKLIRVLAHELGHALGLDHNEDPKAIMYRLNNGVNEKLTNTDLIELKNLCGIK